MDELEHTLSHLPRGKAPGKSGLANELWAHAGLSCRKALRLLLNECLRHEDIPEAWKQGVVIPVPKTDHFTGDLDQLRPITLLETTRKILSAILTRRLQRVIEQHPVLRGLNLGFRANRQAADLAFGIQGVWEASHTVDKPLDLLSLDVRRAYDSVALSVLQRSLRRIHAPESYINLLSNIHTSRSAQVLTAFGLTEPYRPATGLDQGEINAPILWLVVYDPLLCLLEKSDKGIRLSELAPDTPATRKIHPDLASRLQNSVFYGGAYADDLTLMASKRDDLQALANICSVWCEACNIEINPAKSVHLSYDPKTNRPTTGASIEVGWGSRRAAVSRLQPQREPMRILGMYLVPDGSHDPMYEMCKGMAAAMAKMLQSRAMTDKIALFLTRAVIMPALEYKMKGHAFTGNELRRIYRPIMHALKHACHLPITFPSSILHHRLAGKVPRPGTLFAASNLTLQLRAMNDPTLLSAIAYVRLVATENGLRYPGPMLEAPWHIKQVQPGRKDMKGRRLFIPTVAVVLLERGATIGMPTYSLQWTAARALPTPPRMLIDIYRGPLTRSDLSAIYDRADIWASDVLRVGEIGGQMTFLQLHPQPQGRPTGYTQKIRGWLERMAHDDLLRLQRQLYPSRAYPPNARLCMPFTREEIRRMYGQHHSTDSATEWVAYTDGSVIHADGRAKGAFAGVFTQGPSAPLEFRGRILEAPLSSTRVEAMAIAIAIIMAPPNTPLVIHTDSQAAAHMMQHVNAPGVTRELANSPDTFLWRYIRIWVQERDAPVTVLWVQGHSGVEGNERADRLATSAHDDQTVPRWTTRMPPPPGTPFWLLSEGRVIQRRPRRLVREQDEAITAAHLVMQINAVPDRPIQTARDVANFLQAQRWTKLTDGTTRKRKCAFITNSHDSHLRANGYKLVLGFLATGSRERRWYWWVYNTIELYRCAKCGEPDETQEHIFACADHAAVEVYFRAKYLTLQPDPAKRIDIGTLQPWTWMGCLQGRVDPRWENTIPMLQQERGRVESTTAVTQHLLRTALETTYHAIWLPRCQRAIEQERSQGLTQSAKLRRMRAGRQNRGNAHPSPNPMPSLPPSFPDSFASLLSANSRYIHRLFGGHV
jgi:ribonuclease HI